MVEILAYDLVKLEDLDVGVGTVPTRLQDGRIMDLHRINLTSLLPRHAVTLAATATEDGGRTLRARGIRPYGCRTWWVTLAITETFGTSLGLTGLSLGDDTVLSGWGGGLPLTAGTVSWQGAYGGRGDMPVSHEEEDVIVTAEGGLFDGTGALEICVYFTWLTHPGAWVPWYTDGISPGPPLPFPPASEIQSGIVELINPTEVLADTDVERALTIGRLVSRSATETRLGLAAVATQADVTTGLDDTRLVTPLKLSQRLSALPAPPAASETVAGSVELATPAEVQTGTDATRAVTPAGLAAKVPPGTPLSVARYAASGQALETAPNVMVDAAGRLGVGTTTPEPAYGHTITAGGAIPLAVVAPPTASTLSQAAILTLIRRTSGDMVDNFGTGLEVVLADSAGVDHQIGQVLFRRQGADNSGRFLIKAVSAGVLPGNSAPGDLAVDPAGNLSLNADVFASGATRTLALGPGTAPATSPADTVQLTAVDRGGAAGKRSLQVRTEDGTSHVLGDLSGLGTTLTATLGSGASYQALNVKGSTLYVGQSSVQERALAVVAPSWVVSTDASRTARLTLAVYDATAAREGLRLETSGTAPMLGFLGASAVVRQTVPAAATDATTTQALANSLRTALVNLGLCV